MKEIFNNLSPPQQRFIDHLEPKPSYGKDKKVNQFGPKDQALRHGDYIQFNRTKHAYVGLDLDYEAAVLSWMDEVLPAPTIAFHNPETGHANLFWELKAPIYRPCELNHHRVRPHPLKYYKAVVEGYRAKLDGDIGYTLATTKNPFSKRWEVHWNDEQYSLKYLAEFVTLKSTINFSIKNLDEYGHYAGRNDELFTEARLKAYRWAFDSSIDSFDDAVYKFCNDYNRECIPIHWPKRGPLPNSEVADIAHNITTWVAREQYSGGFKQRLKNHGVMELPPIDRNLNKEIKKQITSCNQARGAAFTHRVRKNKTQQKISDAIATIHSQGRWVTKREVAEISGVGLRTLNHYKHLFNTRPESVPLIK